MSLAKKGRSVGASFSPAQRFQQCAQAFQAAMARNDYGAGLGAAEGALKIVPQHMGVLSDYALCLMRLNHFSQAHAVYLRIFNAPPALQAQASATWLDGLAEVCGHLGLRDDVHAYGKLSLERADARHGHAVEPGPRAAAPAAFQPGTPERNIIAYTLFGDSPRYCESAIANVQVARELFPAWRCRVYLDDSVPAVIRQRLLDAGAQVIDMSGSARDGVHPLMWRFLVVDDPEVDRYLIRDADSLLSEREQAAIDQWLASPYWFHHIRDSFTHTELILAGLWGGCRGGLPALKPLMQRWLAQQSDVTRFADQIFLREQVWPMLRQSVLNHDDWFDFHGAQPLPAHAPIRWQTERFHVGSNASFKAIRGHSTKACGERQGWRVLDQAGQEVCRYHSRVQGKYWSADLPFFVAAPLGAGQWRVELTD
ncbi:tetratricopeptide repeat protein [Pseudomonas sp. P7548]|uniref:tetratricopeptide repeat protein n=1 Tax=Pseudomonas sp. P7548 TaxID=2726981 RepID=UPI0015C02A12|nr:tetratricopeptide repeat protein [Pseudomonas sp. P7548]NWE23145.1 tetratricopeptide repeat protein [Pseudomonas sp. P7548]